MFLLKGKRVTAGQASYETSAVTQKQRMEERKGRAIYAGMESRHMAHKQPDGRKGSYRELHVSLLSEMCKYVHPLHGFYLHSLASNFCPAGFPIISLVEHVFACIYNGISKCRDTKIFSTAIL